MITAREAAWCLLGAGMAFLFLGSFVAAGFAAAVALVLFVLEWRDAPPG